MMTVVLTFVVTLLTTTLRSATPLMLGSLGGVFSERSGVVNVALEGIMLMGAWGAVYGSFLAGQAGWPGWAAALAGCVGAVIIGLLTSAIHAVASINYKANQVVSGTGINLLASGFTEFMMGKVWENAGQSPSVPKVGDLFGLNIFVYVAFIAVFASHIVIYYTPWGLRLRAVGEHPRAADTVGVNVFKMRYWGVLLSGFFGGLAGASLSIGLISSFSYGMTAGRGFIALAAVIFGNWTPLGAMAAALLFGASDALGMLFQILGVNVPNQFLQMAPYVITMLALAGLIGRSTAPAADGVPYEQAH